MSGPTVVETSSRPDLSRQLPELDSSAHYSDPALTQSVRESKAPAPFVQHPRQVVTGLGSAAEFWELPSDLQQQVQRSFNALDRSQQRDFIALLNSLSPGQSRTDLISLLERQINQRPAILDRDSHGRTLLQNLRELNTGRDINQNLRQNVRDITADVIAAAARLGGAINQGDKATCTAGASQFALCNSQPAEFARLVAGLTSQSGSVILHSGESLEFVAGSYGARGVNGIFQDALMALGVRLDQSSQLNYNAQTGMSTGTLGLPLASGETQQLKLQYSGLFPHQYELMAEALFNRPLERIDMVAGKGDQVIARIEAQLASDPARGVKADLSWQAGTSDECHAIQITEIKDGRVYYFNSQVGVARSGERFYDVPPRQPELQDGRNVRIESMDLDQFKSRLNCVLVDATPGADAWGATPLSDKYRLDPNGLSIGKAGWLVYYYHLHEGIKKNMETRPEQQPAELPKSENQGLSSGLEVEDQDQPKSDSAPKFIGKRMDDSPLF